MQDAAIEYQFDARMCDYHGRAFNIEDIPIPNPKIKLPVGTARTRRGARDIRTHRAVFAPG
jgi:hypothetical protein